LLGSHWRLAGRFTSVINSQQFFGLSQATVLLACRRGAVLTCLLTNRAASWGNRVLAGEYDYIGNGLGLQHLRVQQRYREVICWGHWSAAPQRVTFPVPEDITQVIVTL
jgi:hypothetical protein